MSKKARIIELESKISFQEKTIEELSDSLIQLDKKLAGLERVCLSLKHKVENLSQYSGLDVGDHNEKPPHY